jgi:hypothetical protein
MWGVGLSDRKQENGCRTRDRDLPSKNASKTDRSQMSPSSCSFLVLKAQLMSTEKRREEKGREEDPTQRLLVHLTP